MTRPGTQALYVMQNEFGLIKIGRSLDPERRRKSIQSGEGCVIALVAVLEGHGHREEAIHLGLQKHIIEGEWFEGTPSARTAITEALPNLAACEWPFDYQSDGARTWLNDFFARRDRRAVERQLSRMLNTHLLAYEAGRSADEMISLMLRLLGVDCDASAKSETIVRRRSQQEAPPPAYTTDLAAASSLWPEGASRGAWEGSAYDCAVAAMQERLRLLRARAVWNTGGDFSTV